MCSRASAGKADMSLRDVTIAQMGNGESNCEWRHAPEARWGFWEFWKKLVELRPASGEDGWLSLARQSQASGLWGGCCTRWGTDEKARIERICNSLSLHVEEPLNSKVIKSFVPELRSRKCFSCFEIPMFYIYIYIYINIICPFRISVSGYGTWSIMPILAQA